MIKRVLVYLLMLSGATCATQICSFTTTNPYGKSVHVEKVCSCGCCSTLSLCCDCNKGAVVTSTSVGEIVGIVIGTILAVGVVVAVLVLLIKCKYPRRGVSGSPDPQLVQMYSSATGMVQTSPSPVMDQSPPLTAGLDHALPSDIRKLPIPSSDISRDEPRRPHSDIRRDEPPRATSDMRRDQPRQAPSDISRDEPPRGHSDISRDESPRTHSDVCRDEPPRAPSDMRGDQPRRTNADACRDWPSQAPSGVILDQPPDYYP